MENRPCEVVGCCRPAAWVCATVSVPLTNLEEALCSHCWANLRLLKPQNALLYTPCENTMTFFNIVSASLSTGFSPEPVFDETIYIG